MFDRCFLLKIILSQKTFEKFNFCITYHMYNGAPKHEGLVSFENACFRAKTYVILMSLNFGHFYACYC